MYPRTTSARWENTAAVVLALLFAGGIFVLLLVVNVGMFTALLIGTVFFAAYCAINYLLWGRSLRQEVGTAPLERPLRRPDPTADATGISHTPGDGAVLPPRPEQWPPV